MKKNQSIPNNHLELSLRTQGFKLIAGLDEVGRGAWAGPLVMGAVILPVHCRIAGLRDSKLLSPSKREKIAIRIKKVALAWGIGVVHIAEINHFRLGQSLILAASRAIEQLNPRPDYLLVDGRYPFGKLKIRQQAIIAGDQSVSAIAAASVIAKVERDQMMTQLHERDLLLQQFRFDLNKGYPSPHHRLMLNKIGPSPHHRLNFKPVIYAQNQLLFIVDN